MNTFIIKGLLAAILSLSAISISAQIKVDQKWQDCVLAAVKEYPQGGGCYTGRKVTEQFPKSAYRAFTEAYHMEFADMRPVINPQLAQPSFANLAVYGVMLKALLEWDADKKVGHDDWLQLKPLFGVSDAINRNGYTQRGGEGCWGRANGYGPGFAVLVKDLKVGQNFMGYRGAKSDKYKEEKEPPYMTDEQWLADEVWSEAQPGDIVKMFWNTNESKGSDSGAIVGCDYNPDGEQENSVNAVFLGYDADGNIRYWTSLEGVGYGEAKASRLDVQRVVFSRINNPNNFTNAHKLLVTQVDKWVKKLQGEAHATTQEVKKNCGIK